jgi:hypothetical protein
MLGIAVVFYGGAAVLAHLWMGQPWGDALLLGALLAAGWLISMDVRERRRFAREDR